MTAQSEGHLRDNKKVIFHPDDTLQIKANSYILFVMPSESKVQYGKKTCIRLSLLKKYVGGVPVPDLACSNTTKLIRLYH